jgi:hypothetical protein
MFDCIVNESIDCQFLKSLDCSDAGNQIIRSIYPSIKVSRFQSTDCFIVDFHKYASRLKIEY